MKAVVLAAGEGTRLRPFTISRPKVMLPVGGRPILEFVIQSLVDNGIKDIVVVVGYRRERIMSYFKDGRAFGARISYVAQERQLGTAHALSLACDELDEEFLVVSGDNLIDSQTIKDILTQGSGPSLLVTRSETPSKYGVVQIDQGKIQSIVEKPVEKIGYIINTGIYRFTPDMLDHFRQKVMRGELGITQVLKDLVPAMEMRAIPTAGRWIDAVYPWDLIALNAAALGDLGQRVEGRVEAGVTFKGTVRIGRGSRIRSGSYVEGPVVIGEGVDIGPHTVIMPSTSIGDQAQIGPLTYLSSCLIMNNVTIGSHCHASRCVIDSGVRMGPNCSCSSGPATTRIEDDFFMLDDIGALVGESTHLEAGGVLAPGSIVGAGCRIHGGARVRGNLENGSIVV